VEAAIAADAEGAVGAVADSVVADPVEAAETSADLVAARVAEAARPAAGDQKLQTPMSFSQGVGALAPT